MSTVAAPRPRTSRSSPPSQPRRLRAWSYALRTACPPPGRDLRTLDAVTGWLVATRVALLPMTLGAGLVGGLLAARSAAFSWPPYLLAVLGAVLGHVCSNLLDDLSDLDDVPDRPRVLGASHAVAAGLVRRRQVGRVVVALWLAGVGVVALLALRRGWPVLAFAGAGTALAFAGPWLRARGLGELAVLLVWGPLAVAGTHWAAVGSVPWQVWLASVPYGLLCATAVLGQSLDAVVHDARTGRRTLPVRLGTTGARALALVALVAAYATTGLAVAVGALPWPVLVVALALPLLRSVAGALRASRPSSPAEPARPLALAPVLWAHARRTGGLLVLGLALAAVLDGGLLPAA